MRSGCNVVFFIQNRTTEIRTSAERNELRPSCYFLYTTGTSFGTAVTFGLFVRIEGDVAETTGRKKNEKDSEYVNQHQNTSEL